MRAETFNKLVQLKKQAVIEAFACYEGVLNVLRAFDKKSITGNKSRITKAIKAVNENLIVDIAQEEYFGTRFVIKYYANNRAISTAEDGTQYIHADYSWVNEYVRNNEIDFAKLEQAVESSRKFFIRELERLKNTTAERVEKAKERKQKLLKELNEIQADFDSEMLEKADYGITTYMTR